MERDSVLGTIVVALVLCVVCALLVASSVVVLRGRQEANKQLDRQKNILLAAGLIEDNATRAEIDEVFKTRVRPILVDLDKGTVVPESVVDYVEYDAREAKDDPQRSQPVDKSGPTPGVDRRERLAFVYEVKQGDEVDLYVLPVYGKGLWSTMWGFLAIDADGQTLRGLTFYEDGETPGLGGEINNKNWQAHWASGKHPDRPKLAFDEQGNVKIRVLKGAVDPSSPEAKYQIDGISGATITSRGVSDMVQYWLGPDGFGPFLKNVTSQESATTAQALSTSIY